MTAGATLRAATASDLPRINGVIERAIMTWSLPERVKRLVLPSYRYTEHDLTHLEMIVAETAAAGVVGVAAWEEAEAKDIPDGRSGLLLHGLYVSPESQRRGIGARLLDAALVALAERKLDGLLVKAQADAAPFFQARGMVALPVAKPERDYPNRFWRERPDSASTPAVNDSQARM